MKNKYWFCISCGHRGTSDGRDYAYPYYNFSTKICQIEEDGIGCGAVICHYCALNYGTTIGERTIHSEGYNCWFKQVDLV